MTEGALIPLIVVLLMVTAGTAVKLNQFALVLRAPAVLVGGTIAQVVVLPLVALLLVWLTGPAPELAAGLLLVSASPGGALSNFYCYLGRLDVSLSLMLTAVSTFASFAVLPIIMFLLWPTVGAGSEHPIPVADMMVQLLLLLLLPVGAGMLLRHLAPHHVKRSAARLRAVGLTLLVVLIGLIVLDQWQTVSTTYLESVVLGVSFTLAAAAAGWMVAALLRLGSNERWVFAIEFAIRNLGAAALVATATLGRPEFLAFGALFVLVQFPLMLLLLHFREMSRALPAT